MQLQHAVDLYLRALDAGGRAAATIRFHRQNVGGWMAWLQQVGMSGSQWCAPESVEEYLGAERARGLAPSTVAARYRTLRAMFRWMVGRGMINASPLAHVAEPRYPQPTRPRISSPEVIRILEAIPAGDAATWLDARDNLIVRILYGAGLRVGELVEMRTANLDTARRLATIPRAKGRRARVVPFGHDLAPALTRYLLAAPAVPADGILLARAHRGLESEPLSAAGVRHILRNRCARAGIARYTPHAFRHGFAWHMLNRGGMAMDTLAKLLGHRSAEITQDVYADWDQDALRALYDAATKRTRDHW